MKINIENLSKTYNSDVLKNLNLKDDNINTIALIGRSGCGKSTLLRILGGLEPKTSGSAIIDDMEVMETAEYRRKIGFVFQQGGLFSHLSALENITLPLIKVHNYSKDDALEIAYSLLKRFGLDHEADKKPFALSGGQRQRISIARAVAPKPKILFLDEPTSALDPEYTSEVLTMISELKDENLSFIIATHEMGFALHSCEKVAFMDGGNILEYGNSNEVFKNPQTKELQTFLSKLLQWKV